MNDDGKALRAEIKTRLARIIGAHIERELQHAEASDLESFNEYLKTETERLSNGRNQKITGDTNEALNQIIEKARAYKKRN